MKITNGVDVLEVTKGAFNDVYKKQGFKPFDEVKEAVEEAEETVEVELTEDELFVKEALEKPIAQWNKNEVKKFAEINEIDIAGTKNVNEAKEIIKDFING